MKSYYDTMDISFIWDICASICANRGCACGIKYTNCYWFHALKFTLVFIWLFRDYSTSQDASAQTNQGETCAVEFKSQTSFKGPVRTQTDDPEPTAHHGKEPSVHWAPGNSPYMSTGQDEPNAYSYLPTVLEEPNSSFSEGAGNFFASHKLRFYSSIYIGTNGISNNFCGMQ